MREVVTLKRDLGVCGDIRLAFRIGDRWIETSEDVDGWPTLMAELVRRFPSISPDRYMTVMFPAFETCDRVRDERD